MLNFEQRPPQVSPETEHAAEVAAAPSLENLASMENPTEEQYRLAAEKIVEMMIENDPYVRSVLEAKPEGPAVDRKAALVEVAVKTLKVRVDGIKKGWADAAKVNVATVKTLSQQVAKFSGKKAA